MNSIVNPSFKEKFVEIRIYEFHKQCKKSKEKNTITEKRAKCASQTHTQCAFALYKVETQ